MRIRLLAATVAVLALAGCGTTTSQHPKAASATTTTATQQPSQAASDAVFDQFAQENGLTAHGDLTLLEVGAHRICAAYASDASFVQVISALTQNGWSGYDAGQMNGAAVAAYCPQYKDKAP